MRQEQEHTMAEQGLHRQMVRTMQEITGDDDLEFMVILLGSYQENTPELLTQIATAHAADDVEAVRRVAHSLKSSSAALGCLDFSGRCAALEKTCKTEPFDRVRIASLVDAVQQAYPAVAAAVTSLIQRLQAQEATPSRHGFGLGA